MAGTVPAGTVPAGTVPAGTVPAGTVPVGTVPVGTVPGEKRTRGTGEKRTDELIKMTGLGWGQ